MTTRRIARLTEAIREQVSTSILFELRDPRVNNVTVTRVEVSPDGQNAKVLFSVLGDEKHAALCLHGLNSARGFLQSRVAARVKTRYTPILKFVLDHGVKHSIDVARLLETVVEPDETGRTADIPDDTPNLTLIDPSVRE